MSGFEQWTLRDGRRLTLRPVHEHDAPGLDALIHALSATDRRCRFHGGVNGVSAARLRAMTRPVAPRDRAWVITAWLPQGERLVADLRWALDETGDAAELALMVAPAWRRLGLGGRAVAAMSRAAEQAGLRWLHGSVLEDNAPMLALMRRSGFLCTPNRGGDGTVAVELQVLPSPRRPAQAPPQPRLRRKWWGLAAAQPVLQFG